MFNNTWKKYLPVIAILLKRTSTEEQVLKMNHTDFERASGGRKMKWSFAALQFNNGRILNNGTKHPSLVTEMVTAFQADPSISNLLKGQTVEFSMTNDFRLSIKNLETVSVVPAIVLTEEPVLIEDTIETVPEAGE